MKHVISQSNQLRKLSNDLVSMYTAIAQKNNSRIYQSTVAMLVIVLALLAGAAFYFKKAIIDRINETLLSIQDIPRVKGT